jgi:hypothetical protein
MWVPATMAGAFGRCAICSGAITVPGEPASGIRRPLTPNDSIVDMPAISPAAELGEAARPHDPLAADFPQPQPAAAAARDCSICQSPIMGGDATHQCASCSQTYHAECWNENHGCAAYGCPEVGILDQAPAAAAIGDLPTPLDAALAAREELVEPERPFPWDFALLGGSVLGTIVGAFSFGLPALVVGIFSAVYARREREAGHYGLATLCAVICLVGFAVGIITSSFLFNVAIPWRIR